MITKELIDYVTTQLSEGVARDKITSDLLGQGGWTMDQINETFQAVEQNASTQVTQQEVNSEMAKAPKNIKYFEWLMYASFVGSITVWLSQSATNNFEGYLIIAVSPLIVLSIRLLFVYLIVYKQISWPRIALLALFVFSAFGTLTSAVFIFSNSVLLTIMIPLLLEVAAIYFMLTKESSAWLAKKETVTVTDGNGNVVSASSAPASEVDKNNVWNKIIPRSNWVTAVSSLGILFIVDVPILIRSPGLTFFFGIMVATFVIFVFFAVLENFVFRKSLKDRTSSGLDRHIEMLIGIRNTAVVLSMVPFIQLFGMAALFLGGLPWLVLYVILVSLRFRKPNNATTTM